MIDYLVCKRNKRLVIEDVENPGKIIYTPPDFVKVPNRKPMQELAQEFQRLQTNDILAIIEFETKWTKKNVTRNLRNP